MKIGIISDTHGIFREEWHRHLDSCDYLIHAGDFCTQKNYDCFRNFDIPLYMVRGNNDRGDWAKNLPEFLQFRIGGKTFFLVHNQFDLPFDLTDADFLIFGHTHHYTFYKRFNKVYINPGSASDGRGDSKSLAILTLSGNDYSLERVIL